MYTQDDEAEKEVSDKGLCAICFDDDCDIEEMITFSCNHKFCKECLTG